MRFRIFNFKRKNVRQLFAFSLSRKIIGSFIIVALLVGLTSSISYYFLKRVDSSYSALLKENLIVLNRIDELQYNSQLQNSLMYSYLVDPSKDKEKLLDSTNQDFSAEITSLADLVEDETLLNDIHTIAESNGTFARLIKKVTDYMNENKPELAKAEAVLWSIPSTEAITTAAIKVKTAETLIMDNKAAANRQMVATTIASLIWISFIALIIALLIGILLSRKIVAPMRVMVHAAGRIAACDLTTPNIVVKNRDEIRDLANAFNQMKINLHEIISQVGNNAEQVAASAIQLSVNSSQVSASTEKITTIVQEISVGTETQLHGVQQGGAIMDEMSLVVKKISDVTQMANLKSTHAMRTAGAGNDAIRSAIDQMNSIFLKMNELTDSVHSLESRIMQIVKAVDLIANIAKRTNMLALNASIEAARVGSFGKGFSVVAEEVRKLSQQTSSAANQVADIIKGILDETSKVKHSTDAGTREVMTGITVVNLAGEAFVHIQSAVDEVANQFEQVFDQSQQISQKTKTAVLAIQSIDRVAQQAAIGTQTVAGNVEHQYASMEEIVASSQMLSEMSEQLQTLIERFKL